MQKKESMCHSEPSMVKVLPFQCKKTLELVTVRTTTCELEMVMGNVWTSWKQELMEMVMGNVWIS